MKIYVLPNQVTLVGKAWEIRAKLREYSKTYTTVEEWIHSSEKKIKRVRNPQ